MAAPFRIELPKGNPKAYPVATDYVAVDDDGGDRSIVTTVPAL